ncbi:MAG TPA: hypothetical protein VHN59_19230 [Chitinophagaceae bacterium]|jgi:hypothetical protein|nr:hypothetical protein [Chitinophagaceae bacterium]
MKKTASKIKKQYRLKIDPSLDKYNDISFCPEKLEQANKTLKAVGLPKLKRK